MSIPKYDIGTWTAVRDVELDEIILHLEGVIILPVGAKIELKNLNQVAEVIEVRILAPNSWPSDKDDKAAYVCLDVRVGQP